MVNRGRRRHSRSGMGPAENGSLLTASFAALAQELITESALAPALRRLLTLMVGVVAGCDCASIWFVASAETGPNVATDECAATLDAIVNGQVAVTAGGRRNIFGSLGERDARLAGGTRFGKR